MDLQLLVCWQSNGCALMCLSPAQRPQKVSPRVLSAVPLDRSKSQAVDMLKMSPADWFGRWQDSGSSEAVPGTEDYPKSLGKVLQDHSGNHTSLNSNSLSAHHLMPSAGAVEGSVGLTALVQPVQTHTHLWSITSLPSTSCGRSRQKEHCAVQVIGYTGADQLPCIWLRPTWLQICAAGARVRVKLDEARIEELLRGSDSSASSAAARVLSCLGDMGQVSFMPHAGGGCCLAGSVCKKWQLAATFCSMLWKVLWAGVRLFMLARAQPHWLGLPADCRAIRVLAWSMPGQLSAD